MNYSLLPEATFNIEAVKLLVSDLEQSLIGFEVIEFKVLSNGARFSSLDELKKSLVCSSFQIRNKICLDFKYYRTSETSKKTTGQIYFDSTSEHAKIVISAGTNRQKIEESAKVLQIFSKHKRAVSGKLIIQILPSVLLISLFVLNYCVAPSRIIAGTSTGTFIIAVLSLPILIYIHYRPHIFLVLNTWDRIQIFPNIIRIFVISFFWFLLIWGIVQAPKWLNKDDRIVADNPTLQREILRQVLTPDILEKFDSLKEANSLYDKAESLEQKKSASEIISKYIFEILYGENGFNKFPLGALPYFVSSASQVQHGNWLAEPLLLHMEAKEENGVFLSKYKPKIDSGLNESKQITLAAWIEEPIIKDKFGRIWTREGLLRDKVLDSSGKLTGSRLNDLRRLRGYPDNSIVFNSSTGKQSVTENTVEAETVRAIGEELIRSMNVIQRHLSEDPRFLNKEK